MIRLHTEQSLILDRDYIKDIIALDKSISNENIFYKIHNGSFSLFNVDNVNSFITQVYNKMRTVNNAKSYLKVSFLEDFDIKNTQSKDLNNIINHFATYSRKYNVTIFVTIHVNEMCEDEDLGLECVHMHIIYEEPNEESLTEFLYKEIY